MLKCHVHNVWCTDHSSMFICTQKTAWRHTLLPDRKMDIYLCQKKLLGSYSYWFLVVYIQYWQVEQNRAKSSIFHFFVQLLSPSNALPHFHTHPIDNGRGLNQATAAVDKLYFFQCWRKTHGTDTDMFWRTVIFFPPSGITQPARRTAGGAVGSDWRSSLDYPNWVKIR